MSKLLTLMTMIINNFNNNINFNAAIAKYCRLPENY